MTTPPAKTLAKKIGALLPDLEAQGNLYLFALAERQDINRWDVIVSSDWSDLDFAGSVRLIADAIVAKLEPNELLMLSGVSIIPSSEPNITDLPESLQHVTPEEEKVIEVTLMGLEVRRAFIFKAQRSPWKVSSRPDVLATAGT